MITEDSLSDIQSGASPGAVAAVNVARQQVERLVVERLMGRKIDGVGFVNELLAIAMAVGEVSCRPVAERGLRFELSGSTPLEAELDGNKGKLRMLCARLAVLCQESGCEFMLYGGEGTIRLTADGNCPRGSWKARWSNTPDKQEFTISAVR